MNAPIAVTEHRTTVHRGLRLTWYRWTLEDAPPERPVVVLLHGFLDCGMSFDPVARVLAEDYTVIAPDHRGHGQSDTVGAGGYYHFPDYVSDLTALLDALSVESAAIIGHSMGASIGVYFTGTHPERVKALALLDGIGPGQVPPEQSPRLLRRWLNDLRLSARREEPTMADLETVAQRLKRTAPHASPARLLELARHAAERGADGLWRWRFDPLHRTTAPIPFDVQRFMAFLRAIACPTTIIWGERSPLRGPDADLRVACIANARQEILEGAGHNLHHERPLELAMTLQAFLHRAYPPADEA